MKTRIVVSIFSGMLLLPSLALAASGPEPSSYALQVKHDRIFAEPIDWVGPDEPPQAESSSLLAALDEFKSKGLKGGIDALEAFLAANPESAWSPSLHMNLAEFYRGNGRYSLALEHWSKAWQATKDERNTRTQLVAARVLAGWTRLLASLGQKEELNELFNQADQLQLPLGTYGSIVQGTKGGLLTMTFKPGLAYRCGSFALGYVAREVHLSEGIAETLFQQESPDGGFHLDQLVALAQSNGIPMVALRRPPGAELITPSVIHWKLNHYAAVLGKAPDGRFRVMDPTFGGEVWMDVGTIDAESSGAFLVPQDKVPAHWVRLSNFECSQIYGKGYPNDFSDSEDIGPDPCDPDEEDSNCDPPSSGDGPGGDDPPQPPPPCGCGMPVWKISEPYMTLWLEDTPLLYRLSNQKWMRLYMRYKHTGEFYGSGISNFGDKWACNLLCYLTLSTNNPNYYTNHMAGGGVEGYASAGSQDYRTGRWFINEPGHGPAIVTPTGAKNRYNLTNALPTGLTYYFLTQRLDRYGRVLETYNYDTSGAMIRLKNVVDMDGKTNTFSYNYPDQNYPYLITSVTNPYGNATLFNYDTSNGYGTLIGMVDAANMTNTFAYNSSDFIYSMTTPYGITEFTFLSGSNYDGTIRRSIDIQEPNGQHQLYAYCDLGPHTPFLDGVCDACRNSYHWNRAQYQLIPSSDLTNELSMPTNDYQLAEVKHWLHGPNDQVGKTVSDTMNGIAPATDASGNREPTWYYYEGQTNLVFTGTLKLVTNILIATYPAVSITRSAIGRPTSITYENYTPGYSQTLATYNNYYDSSGTVLQTVRGPHNELVRGYGFSPTFTNLLTSVTNAVGDVLSYTYDTNTLKVTSVTFRSGMVRSNIYYSSGVNKGFLAIQMDLGFRTNSFAYSNGNISGMTNELGLITTYLWDNLNRLVYTSFPDGSTISNQYKNLDIVGVKDRLNQWTHYGYDSIRQLTALTNVNGQVTQYTYCGCGSPNSIGRWNNGAELMTYLYYDVPGRLTNVLYPDNYQINYSYDFRGLLTAISDSGGYELSLDYSQVGLKFKPADGYLTAGLEQELLFSQQFDEYSRVTNSVDRNGVIVTNSYDFLDRVLQRRAIGVGSYGHLNSGLETFAYNSSGLTNYTDPLGNSTFFVRDGARRLIYETNANNEVLQFFYNPSDELTNLVDGKGQSTKWGYDQYGRVVSKLDALGTNSFSYAYDSNDRVTSRTMSTNAATTYHYDPIGNLTNVVYPVSSNIVLMYDGLNRLTNVVCGSMTNNFTWTPGDQLASESGSWTDDKISYVYNNRLRQSLSLLQPDRSPWTQTYGYDEFARLTNVTSAAGAFGMQYASIGNPVGSGNTAADLVSQLNYPSGAASERGYDPLGELTNSTLYAADLATILDQHQYRYDQGLERTQQVFQVGNYMNYTYDKIGQLKTALGFEYGGTSRSHEQFGYAFDKGWNLNYRTNNSLVETFSANAANELASISRIGTLTVAGFAEYSSPLPSVTVSNSGFSPASGPATVYNDGSWARAGATINNGQNIYLATATDSLGRTSQDMMTNTLITPLSFSYDPNGNLLNDGQRYFSYDDENQLTSVTVSNAWRSEFTYDGLMRRRKRVEYTWSAGTWLKTNEVRYVYDDRVPIQERDANNLPTVTQTRGNDLSRSLEAAGGIGGLLARTDAGLLTLGSPSGHTFYHFDGNGNVTCLINMSNAVVARYVYDPFGNLLAKSGSLADANLYRFSSKEFHANSGLSYYLYRYFDPNLQRWLSRDPLGETDINLYALAFGNPLISVDSWGLCDEEPEGEITREILNEMKASRQGLTGPQLEKMEEQIEKNTQDAAAKYERNPPYFGKEPIMRALIPKGQVQKDEPKPQQLELPLLPRRTSDNDKTSGVLNLSGESLSLTSGKQGPGASAPGGPGSGFDAYTRTHVEGHAAAQMRQTGALNGTLFLNNSPCSSCTRNLPSMLPPGGKLTIIGPDGVARVFCGR